MRSRWIRLLPIMMVAYIIAFLDRTNIGFAIPYMGKDLALGSTILGFASGVLFLGYALSMPFGGWLGDRGYARSLVAVLLVTWGLVEISQAFVNNATQLVVIRFFLGLVEGGIFPVFLRMVRNWFSSSEQARANGVWQLCYPIGAAIGSPISGYLVAAFSWRGLFVVEGLFPIVWALIWLWGVADSPLRARWLSGEERRAVAIRVRGGSEQTDTDDEPDKFGSPLFRRQMRRPAIWLLIGGVVGWEVAFLAFVIWLPSVLKQHQGSLSPVALGWLSSLPFIVSIVALLGLTRLADRTMKRRLVAVAAITVAGVMLIVGAVFSLPLWLSMVLLSIAACGIYGGHPVLWSIPSEMVPVRVHGIVLGVINGIGVIGAFGGPYVVGWARSLTGSFAAGLSTVGICALIAAGLLLAIRQHDMTDSPLATRAEV